MIDSNFFDELASKISKLVPNSVKDVQREMERNIKSVLQNAFAKLDLVTREEFDAQIKVLARTREKLVAIEKQIEAMEAHKKKTKKDE